MVLSHSGGLSTQQQKKERSRKRQAIESVYENEFRRVMKALRDNIKTSKGAVRTELETLQTHCHQEREVLSKKARAEFDAALGALRTRRAAYLAAVKAGHREKIAKLQKERRELSDEIKHIRTTWPDIWKGSTITAKADFDRFVMEARSERASKLHHARQECLARGSSALSNATKKLHTLEGEKKERLGDRQFAKQYKAAGKKMPRAVSATQRRKEKAQESDDEVRGNIPPELLPIFEMIKGGIKGNARLSRTEAFMKAYEEDQGNLDARLIAKQEAENERQLEAWMKEQKEVEAMRARAETERMAKSKTSKSKTTFEEGSDEWAREAAAQAEFLEKQRVAEESERKAKERSASKKSARKKQTQFTSRSGTAITEKRGKQKALLDDEYGDAYVPPGTVYNADADDFFGVPL